MSENKWPWDQVYVINLDKDVERMEKIKKQLDDLKIDYFRLSATNGFEKFPLGKKIKEAETLNEKWNLIEKMNRILIKYKITHKNIRKFNKYLKPGQYGNLDSNKRVMLDIIKNNYEKVLILEDDCILTNDFKKKIFDTYNNLPNDCDILYLGLNSLHLKITGIPKKINPFVSNLIPVKPKSEQKKFKYGIVYGSHALLINKKVAIEWLKAAYPVKWPSDWVFGKLIFESKKIKGYCCDLIEASSDFTVDSNTELI